MAAGIPKGPVHCKRCNTEYSSFSELRKHQWAEHKNLYKNTGKLKPKKGWTKQQRAKYKATIATKNGSVRGFLNGATGVKLTGEMSAKDVLDELRKQRDFMNDIVDMVEGMIK